MIAHIDLVPSPQKLECRGQQLVSIVFQHRSRTLRSPSFFVNTRPSFQDRGASFSNNRVGSHLFEKSVDLLSRVSNKQYIKSSLHLPSCVPDTQLSQASRSVLGHVVHLRGGVGVGDAGSTRVTVPFIFREAARDLWGKYWKGQFYRLAGKTMQ